MLNIIFLIKKFKNESDYTLVCIGPKKKVNGFIKISTAVLKILLIGFIYPFCIENYN